MTIPVRLDETPVDYKGIKDFLLDDAGDLVISSVSKDFMFTRNMKEYATQSVRQKIRTFLGEYFLNTTIGIPYFQSVLTKGFDLRIIQTSIVEQISSVVGIKEITFYSHTVDKATRTLRITFEAILDNNEVISSTESI